MRTSTRSLTGALVSSALLLAVFLLAGCSTGDDQDAQAAKAQLKSFLAERAATDSSLVKFDTLDFTVFSNQEWTRLHESHAKDIKVYWPDGHMTQGIEKHIEDLKAMFVYAPDTRIKQHPIRFGAGKFTAVTGVFEGTFTKPMPIGKGKFIQPTGKAFNMPMATIGIWEDGVMV